MKIIKRIFSLFAALSLALLLSVSAFAAEGEPINTEDVAANEATIEAGEVENPFETVFNTVSSYSSEIFSALAFVGTLIVAHFYKKGMLPTLKKALSGVSTALGKVSEATEGSLLPIADETKRLSELTSGIKNTVDTLSASLEGVESELSAIKETKDEREAYRIIMLSQVDMLYDIFMSSSLPQYKKDEIGKRIGEMREELNLYNENAK